MTQIRRAILIAGLLAASAALSGCSSGGFDVDKLDVFGLGSKPKLPGERKPLFPEGVPGVSQGVPPHLVKGNQPAPDAALTGSPSTQSAAAPPDTGTGPAAATGAAPRAAPEPRARTRPRPNVVRAPSGEPASVTVQPASQSSPRPSATQTSTGANQAPWPAPPPPPQATGANAPWPSAPTATTAPWPDAPAPGTFSR